jgi:hypothetical protein
MAPTIGRIVLYQVSESDTDLHQNCIKHGDFLPAIVVRVWNHADSVYADLVNLRVLCDGTTDAWKTSIREGTEPATWSWPPRP